MHITVSTLVGVGYGASAWWMEEMPLSTCLLAGGLCGVSGMLPDIDSGPGIPLRESLAFAAAVISTMLVDRFQQFGMSMEWIVLAGALVYLLIRFALAEVLRRWTVHRGMFHSIPAALIFGELAFLLGTGTTDMRVYKAMGVVLGYLSHLLLDELYSIQWGHAKVKKSFGTALKLFGPSVFPNLTTYAKLIFLTFISFKEPGWMEQTYRQQVQPTAQHVVQRLKDFASQTPQANQPATATPNATERTAQQSGAAAVVR